MRQAWLRKQFVEALVSGVIAGDLPVSEASSTLYAFILDTSRQQLTDKEKLLLKAVLDGALGLAQTDAMGSDVCVQQILRLANLSATGQQLRF